VTPAFDTHAHLQDEAFAADLPIVVECMGDAGVAGAVVCGYDPASNAAALALAAQHPRLFPAVGYHPHDAKDVTPSLLAELESLASLPAVVAVGEIGLDFYRDHSPHDRQREVLDAQLAIALSVRKPVSVHSRAAEDAIFEHLSAYSRTNGWRPGTDPIGVMHCFGGTVDQARRYVELGFLVSLACTLTYPRNHETRTIASDLALESLVVETDSPYLPPQDRRGGRNEPANVRAVVGALAGLRGITIDETASATTANAVRLFGVTLPAKVAAR
jgi:TatD DNase family protein